MKNWKFWKKEYEQEERDELDELLYQYMPKYEEKLMEELESKIDYEYEFSDNYRRKMARLIRKERYLVPKRVLKRVAVGIAVFLVSFCLSMYWGVVSGNAQWTKLYETIKTIWEDSFLYSYFKKSNVELEVVYEPTYVPEGYELVKKIENIRMYGWIYEKEDKSIRLRQWIIKNESRFIGDSDFIKEEAIRVQDMEIALYYYEDGSTCSYYEYLDSIFIIEATELNKEEMIKIYKEWIK